MRIIRLKIDSAVQVALKNVAVELKAAPDFIFDVYSLIRLKGNGLPSTTREESLIDQLAKKVGKLNARIIVKKQAQVLKNITKLTYFTSVSNLPNPIFATEKLMTTFNQIGKKVRQSQCQSCTHQTKCDFGKQYSGLTSDITKIVDPDFQKKAHPDCPHLPELDFANKMNDAVKMMVQIMSPKNKAQNQAMLEQLKKDQRNQYGSQPLDTKALDELEKMEQLNDPDNIQEDDESISDHLDEEDFIPNQIGGAGRTGGRFTGSFTAEYYVNVLDTLIQGCLKVGLDIFEIAQNLDNLIGKGLTKDFKPVAEMSENQDTTLMKTLSDVIKMDPGQLALPDEVIEHKIAKKELIVKQENAPQKKRQLLYMLIDSSGSMRTQIMGANKSILSRATFVTVLMTAFLKKVRDDNGIVFLRFFDNGPGALYSMRNKDEFDRVIEKLRHNNYSGGGTNIQRALTTAIEDITVAKDEIAKAEILLATDGEDSISLKKAALGKIKLSVLDVAGASSYYAAQYANDPEFGTNALKAMADAYYKADENNLSLKDIVKLV